MLFLESKVKVADNSGIRTVKCLKFLNGYSNNSKGTLGNIAVVSIADYKGYKKKSSRKVFLGIIVSLKKWVRRKTGFFVRAGENRIVLLDNKDKMLGKAVKGPVALELREKNISKILFLAKVIF